MFPVFLFFPQYKQYFSESWSFLWFFLYIFLPLFYFLQPRAEYLSPYVQSAYYRAATVADQCHCLSEDTVRTSCFLMEFSVEWKDSSSKKTKKKRLFKSKSNLLYEEKWRQACFKNCKNSAESKKFANKYFPALCPCRSDSWFWVCFHSPQWLCELWQIPHNSFSP